MKKKKCKICLTKFTPTYSTVQMFCSRKCEYEYKKQKGSKKRKKTGEKELFDKLWKTRKHVSFVSGEPLGDEAEVQFFSHILTKGSYPSLRLDPRNIQFMTKKEHVLWDFGKDKIKDDPKWKHVFELRDKLRLEYYESC